MAEIKIPFKTAYNFNNYVMVDTDPGSPVQDVFAEQIDLVTKEPTFVKVGERDLNELHQRDLEGTDINMLAKRYYAGDLTAISQMADVFYGDSTLLPKDSLDAANTMLFARQSFDKLPLEEKERFHGNYLEWIDSVSKLDRSTLEKAGLAKFADVPIKDPVISEKGETKVDE